MHHGHAAHLPHAYADIHAVCSDAHLTTPLSTQSTDVEEPEYIPVRPGPTFVDGEMRVPAGYAEACAAARAERDVQERQLDHQATLQVSRLLHKIERRKQSKQCCGRPDAG